MKNAILFFSVFALSLPLFFGCENAVKDETSDATAPTVGAEITFSGTSVAETGVSWGAASDNVTSAADLRYKLVIASSSDAIDTVAEAEAIADVGLAMDWTAGATAKSVTGLAASTAYYFAVLVKDTAGNESLYAPASVTTLSAATSPVPVPVPVPDTTAPTLSVSSGGVTGVTAMLRAMANEAGTSYYVITTSSTAPTAAQVIAGSDGTGAAAIKSGNGAVAADTAINFNISGLSALTKYHYYGVATDGSGNVSAVVSGKFATIASGCIARYEFENALTDSIGAYTLAGTASATYTSTAKEGSAALSLDGSTNFTSGSTITLTNAVTFSAWVKLDTTHDKWLNVITLHNTAALSPYNINCQLGDPYTDGSGNESFQYWLYYATSSDYCYVDNIDTYTPATWAFVTFTWDGTKCVSYLNGGKTDENSVTSSHNISGTYTVDMGSSESSTYYWKGLIDDVQIYNRVLSASEVAKLYADY